MLVATFYAYSSSSLARDHYWIDCQVSSESYVVCQTSSKLGGAWQRQKEPLNGFLVAYNSCSHQHLFWKQAFGNHRETFEFRLCPFHKHTVEVPFTRTSQPKTMVRCEPVSTLKPWNCSASIGMDKLHVSTGALYACRPLSCIKLIHAFPQAARRLIPLFDRVLVQRIIPEAVCWQSLSNAVWASGSLQASCLYRKPRVVSFFLKLPSQL